MGSNKQNKAKSQEAQRRAKEERERRSLILQLEQAEQRLLAEHEAKYSSRERTDYTNP